MKSFSVFVSILLSLLAAQALAQGQDNASTPLQCHSIAKGVLRLGSETGWEGYVSPNANATNGKWWLLCKSEDKTEAEVFDCDQQPKTEEDDGKLMQLRVGDKCATVAHGGFGGEVGLQLDDCQGDLKEGKNQWLGAVISDDKKNASIVPVDIQEKGYGLLSMGVVSTYFDALAFSYGDVRNEKAKMLGLYLDME